MSGRALVLGGGGVTGVAWEVALLARLAELGCGTEPADVLVGTSAGSVVAALVATGVSLDAAYEAQLAGYGREIAVSLGPWNLARFGWASLRARSPEEFGARVGRLALAASTRSEAERRAVIASRLPVHAWPERRLLITAIDALTGALRVLDRASGVELVDAVAASCAVPGVWPPVTLSGRRYIDGGIASPANLTLARGCDRVLVLAPLTRGLRGVASVPREAAALEREGARVLVVSPDAAARAAIGRNPLDPARRAAAARAGRAQAARVRDAVHALWADAP